MWGWLGFGGVVGFCVCVFLFFFCVLGFGGLGVLITDHNVRETLDVCERAYIVGEGKIIATGTPEQVMNDEHVKRVYLGEQFKL